jgi:hypothetical protein
MVVRDTVVYPLSVESGDRIKTKPAHKNRIISMAWRHYYVPHWARIPPMVRKNNSVGVCIKHNIAIAVA